MEKFNNRAPKGVVTFLGKDFFRKAGSPNLQMKALNASREVIVKEYGFTFCSSSLLNYQK